MSAQLNLFETEEETALTLVSKLKGQMDAMRKKLFAENQELKQEIEFLSLQLQMLIEEKDR